MHLRNPPANLNMSFVPPGVVMWEVFSGGEMPYREIKNPDVIQQVVVHRKRLECPRSCPAEVYDIMLTCWKMVGLVLYLLES